MRETIEGKIERQMDKWKQIDGGRRKIEQDNWSTCRNERLFMLWRDGKDIKMVREENNSEWKREGEG